MRLSDVDGIKARPLGRHVLVKMLRRPNMYKGIVALPDRMGEKPNNGIVVRMGSKAYGVRIGEWVTFNWRNGTEIDDDLLIIDCRALLSVLAEDWEVLMKVATYGYVRNIELSSDLFKVTDLTEVMEISELSLALPGHEALILYGDYDIGWLLIGIAHENRIPVFDVWHNYPTVNSDLIYRCRIDFLEKMLTKVLRKELADDGSDDPFGIRRDPRNLSTSKTEQEDISDD